MDALARAADGGAPRESRRRWTLLGLAVFGVFTLDGLLRFGYFYLGNRAMSGSEPAVRVLIEELTGGYATGLLFVGVVLLSRRFRIRRRNWARRIPLYAGALVAYSVLKTSLMWGSRSVLAPLAGLGPYDYGRMSLRYPMEFFNDVPWFVVTVGAVHAWLFYRDAREGEVRTARLEARLADARLAALQARLRPHFLFNTLNTISSVMYRSPELADRIVGRLGELLRAHMAGGDRQQVSLAEELATADLYLEIIRARLGGRLTVETEVEPEVRDTLVPRFLLQPLVENAVKHGLGRSADAGWIRIAARSVGDRVRIMVEDDGPGFRPPAGELVGRGIGLADLRERLDLLHSDRARLSLESRRPRGARVVVELPARELPAEGDGAEIGGATAPGSRGTDSPDGLAGRSREVAGA